MDEDVGDRLFDLLDRLTSIRANLRSGCDADRDALVEVLSDAAELTCECLLALDLVQPLDMAGIECVAGVH